ncbi:MAG: pimeloyl-ACP methyl ester carboxylesterase [Planctomycetota bacterium]|jgi:pimeloyl-ACP methyl ester carboxylesterase
MFGADIEGILLHEEFGVNRPFVKCLSISFLTLWLAAFAADAKAQDDGLQFHVSFTRDYARKAKTGTIYLLVSKDLNGEPRTHMARGSFDGFIFRRTITDLKTDEAVIFNWESLGYPGPLALVKPGRYNVQALLDVNQTRSEPGFAHGNGISSSRRMQINPKTGGNIEITIEKEVIQPKRDPRYRVHYEHIESRIVGRQLGSRFFVEVTVVMPINVLAYPDKVYPIQIWLPDIGENTRNTLKYYQERGLYTPLAGKIGEFGKEFIFILLNTTCRNGYHGWTDSQNNGSFRKALYEEILPVLKERFPIADGQESRFLVGKGAGGLAALNLLANRPDFYAGAWALAPDPVDFHDFYGLDLYAEPLANAFKVGDLERPLVRHAGKAIVTMKQQVRFENVVKSGNLLQSYDASFGERGADLRPKPLIDARTGKINPKAAARFRKRDFANTLRTNWATLGSKIQSKINIIVGDQDDFYLHRPVTRLKAFLDEKNAKANITVIPKLDHKAMNNREIHLKIQADIMKQWKK